MSIIKSNIISLFPTQLYCVRLERVPIKSIKKHILDLSKKEKTVTNTNIGGWQSKPLTIKNKPIIPLVEEINNQVNLFAEELSLKTPLKLANIWANVNGFGHSNSQHIHPKSILSGVYYVDVPEKSGNLCFLHPKYEVMGYDWQGDTIKNFNFKNSSEWSVTPETGLLFIFPGWASHLVNNNQNKKEKRISISFNYIYEH